MPPFLWRKRSFGVLVSSVLAFSLLYGVSRAEGVDYSFPEAPEEIVVKLEIYGGLSMERVSHVLRGDGQLQEIQSRGADAKERVVTLGPNEMADILSLVVEGGLAGWDESSVRKRLEDGLGYVPVYTDAPTIHLQLSLKERNGVSGQDAAISRKEIVVGWSPRIVRHLAPDLHIPEVEALQELQDLLKAYFEPSEGVGEARNKKA